MKNGKKEELKKDEMKRERKEKREPRIIGKREEEKRKRKEQEKEGEKKREIKKRENERRKIEQSKKIMGEQKIGNERERADWIVKGIREERGDGETVEEIQTRGREEGEESPAQKRGEIKMEKWKEKTQMIIRETENKDGKEKID